MSKPVTDRLPPHAPEAEAGVLGCVLAAGLMATSATPADVMNTLLERRVAGEWFYDLRHQTVFNAMVDLHGRQDVPVDVITLQQSLKDHGKLEEVGGIPFLNSLQDAVAGSANVSYWLDIVREKFVLRQLISSCTELVGQAYEHTGSIDGLLAEAEHAMESLTGTLM